MPVPKENKGFKPTKAPRILDHYLDIQGTDLESTRALWELAYSVSQKGAIFIEIGSWIGRSTSILGEVAKRDGGQVFCVDHWTVGGSLETFRHNMEALELDKVIHPLVMESATAATIFADGIADMVFIDADHRYKSAKQDIELWWSKVKEGGVLCGHDCEGYYSDFPPQIRKRIDETLNEDYQFDICCHSGVIKALHDYFGHKFSIKNGTIIWYKRKVL